MGVVRATEGGQAATIRVFFWGPDEIGPQRGSGSSSGQFDNPRGIAVDGAGNVYVADQGNNRVQVFGQVR